MDEPRSSLPPGQYASRDFPRFGMPRFAHRFPRVRDRIHLEIGGEVRAPTTLTDRLQELPRVDQVSDFHCVTTWTHRDVPWSGFRFLDFFERLILPEVEPSAHVQFVVFKGQDGYRTGLFLDDLLQPDVLLADRLGGEALSVEHGAPLRLVAPAHYGYKSLKHLCRMEFWSDDTGYRPGGLRFMEHPRARVGREERGRGVPGWLLRWLYRPLIRPTARYFRRAMEHDRQS